MASCSTFRPRFPPPNPETLPTWGGGPSVDRAALFRSKMLAATLSTHKDGSPAPPDPQLEDLDTILKSSRGALGALGGGGGGGGGAAFRMNAGTTAVAVASGTHVTPAHRAAPAAGVGGAWDTMSASSRASEGGRKTTGPPQHQALVFSGPPQDARRSRDQGKGGVPNGPRAGQPSAMYPSVAVPAAALLDAALSSVLSAGGAADRAAAARAVRAGLVRLDARENAGALARVRRRGASRPTGEVPDGAAGVVADVQGLLQQHAAQMAAVKAKEARPKDLAASSPGGKYAATGAGRRHGGAAGDGDGRARRRASLLRREEEDGMEDDLLNIVFADVPRTIPPLVAGLQEGMQEEDSGGREKEAATLAAMERLGIDVTGLAGSGPEVGLNADVEFVSSWLKNLAAPSASEKGAVDPLEARRLDLETSLRTTEAAAHDAQAELTAKRGTLERRREAAVVEAAVLAMDEERAAAAAAHEQAMVDALAAAAAAANQRRLAAREVEAEELALAEELRRRRRRGERRGEALTKTREETMDAAARFKDKTKDMETARAAPDACFARLDETRDEETASARRVLRPPGSNPHRI
ncbi:hypothetical protein T484DRAFT_1772241 [Baffinella frigidus]|nr:hypothetical protein T484DRAFT_1772241 [Cryptophyta sp. CCMP2293]